MLKGLRIALGATSLAVTALQRCAEGVATACEVANVACWAIRTRAEGRR